MKTERSIKQFFVSVCLLGLFSNPVFAAVGEMGIGIPDFGIYAKNANPHITVWSLGSASVPFPAGCTTLTVTPDILGADAYKLAVATLLLAKATNKKVRFYNHSTLNGACGFDYFQIYN